MALKISKQNLSGWKGKALRAQARMRNISAKADETVQTLVHTAEVGSAAFVSGVVNGKTGGIEVVGVPLDLGLAAGLHVLGFAGVGGKMSGHLHGFADGFLAAFLATTGLGVGKAMAAKSPAATSGLPGGNDFSLPSGGATLNDLDLEMAAMAAGI